MAHQAAQLLLIKMEEVQPRNKEPDPPTCSGSRIWPGPSRVAGSSTAYKERQILDVHGNVIFRS